MNGPTIPEACQPIFYLLGPIGATARVVFIIDASTGRSCLLAAFVSIALSGVFPLRTRRDLGRRYRLDYHRILNTRERMVIPGDLKIERILAKKS